MVQLQVLNKVLVSQDYSFIEKYNLDESHFVEYSDEFAFIKEHKQKYGKVPDMHTFMAEFTEWTNFEVTENDFYLIEKLNEERLYSILAKDVNELAEYLQTDSTQAVEFLRSRLPEYTIANSIGGVDIIHNAKDRVELYEERKNKKQEFYITTGFKELDAIIGGWQAKGEEFVVFFARTSNGKSWVLTKSLTHAWQIGHNVGYISPEMSPTKIGYRFDTTYKHFPNKELIQGGDVKDYDESYINELAQRDNNFVVATPADFQKKITVSKLKTFIEANKLDILGIDGITYLTDERYKRGDSKNISLTNISEDLLQLSIDCEIPILVVVQSNRLGVKDNDDEGTPELHHIRDSDGIAHNATKAISIRKHPPGVELGIKKHRDGDDGGKLIYKWNPNTGDYVYVPSTNDAAPPQQREERVREVRNSFNDGKTDVF